MSINLIVLGLIFDFFGVSILILVTLFGKWHQKNYVNPWTKRYWWEGWRPFYKNTETLKWKTKWNRKIIINGFVPPKHMWNIIGFLFIGLGFLLQIIGNLKNLNP